MKDKIIKKLKSEYNQPFQGWDFRYLTASGRMQESQPSWDYRKLVEEYLKQSDSLLDMGTGGGEFLVSLQNLPQKVCATEGYEPNLKIAATRMKEINGVVKFIGRDNIIPFDDNSFGLVINRHEEFSATKYTVF